MHIPATYCPNWEENLFAFLHFPEHSLAYQLNMVNVLFTSTARCPLIVRSLEWAIHDLHKVNRACQFIHVFALESGKKNLRKLAVGNTLIHSLPHPPLPAAKLNSIFQPEISYCFSRVTMTWNEPAGFWLHCWSDRFNAARLEMSHLAMSATQSLRCWAVFDEETLFVIH